MQPWDRHSTLPRLNRKPVQDLLFPAADDFALEGHLPPGKAGRFLPVYWRAVHLPGCEISRGAR